METEVTSDIPGIILKVNVRPGDRVKSGDVLIVMEAMKMELEVPAPSDGLVGSVHVKENDVVQAGQVLARIRQTP